MTGESDPQSARARSQPLVPFVFVHRGASWYLPYALRQAVSVNGRSGVVLLCDKAAEPAHRGIQRILVDQVESGQAETLRRVYLHMSTNPHDYELLCWLRWLFLFRYMELEGLEEVFYLDSDVLTYRSTAEILASYGDGLLEYGLLAPEQDHESLRWMNNGSISYWKRSALGEFCAYLTDSFVNVCSLARYRRKWEWHRATGRPGGINDMTGLYLFAREYGNYTNLARVHSGATFDLGMHTPHNLVEDEYAFDKARGHKVVRMQAGMPYFVGAAGRVAANALHFAGPTRPHMRDFYKGGVFPAHARWKVATFRRRVAARLSRT